MTGIEILGVLAKQSIDAKKASVSAAYALRQRCESRTNSSPDAIWHEVFLDAYVRGKAIESKE